jgi:hypothetical protein
MNFVLSFASKLCNIIHVADKMDNISTYVFVLMLYLDDMYVVVINFNCVSFGSLNECNR